MSKLLIRLNDVNNLQERLILPHQWLNHIDTRTASWLSVLIREYWIVEDSFVRLDKKAFDTSHWMSKQKSDLLIRSGVGDIPTQRRIISRLIKQAWITKHSRSAEDIKTLLLSKKTKQVLDLPEPSICEWCECSTYILSEHHYPIPRSKGGEDVVRICSNCHTEYHALEDQKCFYLTESLAEVSASIIGGAA